MSCKCLRTPLVVGSGTPRQRNSCSMDGAQQDGAAGCDPIAVGAILGVLRKVGLTGPRLALQIGEEADVARQVAERAGVPCDEWAVDLVKAQVKDAYDTVELEARLEGSAKTPGAQAVDDAVANITKAAQSQAAGSTGPPSRPSVEVPKRGKLAKLPKGVALAGSTGNMEEDKVVQLLYEELSLMGPPSSHRLGKPPIQRGPSKPCLENTGPRQPRDTWRTGRASASGSVLLQAACPTGASSWWITS